MKLGKSCVELHYASVFWTQALLLLVVCFHSSIAQNSAIMQFSTTLTQSLAQSQNGLLQLTQPSHLPTESQKCLVNSP